MTAQNLTRTDVEAHSPLLVLIFTIWGDALCTLWLRAAE